MAISFKPHHLKRYKDIAWLFMKYGRIRVGPSNGVDEPAFAPHATNGTSPEAEASELAGDLERLGPTFVKLGQLLSTRSDLLPPPYIAALSRLQDKVQPFDYAEVEEIVSTELGSRISCAFAEFEPKSIAAASLGQVHRARLRDGRPVAVKVQRPHIVQQITEDLAALAEIAGFLDRRTQVGRRYEFGRILEDLRKGILRELDYKQEAHNLTMLADNLKELEMIVVPRPVAGYTTSKVLTMDYIQGKKVTSLSPLAAMEIAGKSLSEHLFKAYLKQILVDGFFHADPHPGNVFLTDDSRIALIDLGMTARIAPVMQEKLLKLLLAISDGRAEEAAAVAIELGEPREDFDGPELSRRVVELVGNHQDALLGQIDVGKVVLEVTRIAGENGLRPAHDLTLLGKTLLNLDQVGRALNPFFDPNESIRRNVVEIMRQRMWKSFTISNCMSSFLEVKDLLARLPGRFGKIFELLATNEFKITVDTIDEKQLTEGFQKIANRITLGLVLAAMIIAAALLMRVETSFRLFGYPGLAILLFLLATTGGAALVLSILVHDRRQRKRR